jgi:predicted GTPase
VRTNSKVKVGEKEGEWFETAKGVRQGCLLRQDDLVIVAKSERETKEMMRSLRMYVRKKKPGVNVEKTKMMFNKRKKKREESEFK